MIKRNKATDVDGNVVNIRPNAHETVSVKSAGNVTEIKYVRYRGKGGTTKKLSKTEYVDTRTGEIKQFNPQIKRTDDIVSVVRTIKQGRDIIRANCFEPRLCRFLTLTYADNMTDPKKLANDYKNFLKRLPEDIKPYKWVSAVEPQKRGAWHLHVIFVYQTEAPYVENSVIRNAWKQGFVRVEAVDDVDDIGAYLCAYLTDVDVSDEVIKPNADYKTVIDKDTGTPKRIQKGARLCMYPAGMHIFRWSKNCIKPSLEIMTSTKADERIKNHTLVYENTSYIEDTESGFKNTINTRVYNKARKVLV